MNEIVVYPCGPSPAKVMIIGERPGAEEALNYRAYGYDEPTPFIGASGREQDTFLEVNGLHRRRCRLANVCWDYKDGNPDPTAADIDRWTLELEAEIRRVNPSFVLAVGRFATRWFLGSVDMDSVHGLPHRSSRAPDAVIIPTYHPAFGLYDPDAKGLVFHDYRQAARIIKGEISSEPVVDHITHPSYTEVTSPRQLRHELEWVGSDEPVDIALDTEGVPDEPWSLQFSINPGTGIVLRVSDPSFESYIAYLHSWMVAHAPPLTVVVHNTMYDIEMCRVMGLDLRKFRLYDTMVAAYLLRTEPQSLKHLARRHCGMAMVEYREVIGNAADDRRTEYLFSILERSWPKPEPRLIQENDLTTRMYVPTPIERRVEKILLDWDTARDNLESIGRLVVKPDNKDEFDVVKRWRAVDDVLRAAVEAELGPFPDATLDDVPLDRAIAYSGRDPDATLRVYHRIAPMVVSAGLQDRMSLMMSNMGTIEEMQSTGMLASRQAFVSLSARMNDEMATLCSRLSNRFNDGNPINPNSPDHVRELMSRRGLRGAKKTKKTKQVSTSKKSVEHLRHTDDAMSLVIDWRERQKTRDSFSDPILERIPVGREYHRVRSNIRITRVSSSRPSATDPPLLAIPVRHELGVAVRECFVAPRTDAEFGQFWREMRHEPVDCYIGTWDLSQIEMRVMAHLSRDPLLIKLFLEGRDIHCETAIRIFGLSVKPEKDERGQWVYPGVKKKEQRDPTKRAGFGVITGIQGEGLFDQLRMMGAGEGWDARKCDDLIRDWFGVYKGVKTYIEDCRRRCRNTGYARDMGGHYRYLPGIWSKDDRARAEAERQSHSHEIQGSAAWMIQRAMAWLGPQINDLRDSTGWFIRWLLWIHDEVLFWYPEEAESIMADLVTDALINHSYKLRVPVEANHAFDLNWGKLK